VRGDSLRDLYAKTLALVGLGVLAAAGALVDSWPAGWRLVSVDRALALPEQAQSLPLPVSPLSTATPAVPRTREVALPSSVGAVAEEAPFAVARPEPLEPDVLAAPIEFGQPIMVLAANGVGAEDALPAEEFGVVDQESDGGFFADPSTDRSVQGGWSQPASLDRGAPDEGAGFLTGALRKTGSSLVRVGARTGASIVDAVRVVGGAARRALPN
jgi:hypothetical protein